MMVHCRGWGVPPLAVTTTIPPVYFGSMALMAATAPGGAGWAGAGVIKPRSVSSPGCAGEGGGVSQPVGCG